MPPWKSPLTSWLLAVGIVAVFAAPGQQVYQQATEPKESHVIEGATHIDLHDRPQFVTPAVAKLKEEFLGRQPAAERAR